MIDLGKILTTEQIRCIRLVHYDVNQLLAEREVLLDAILELTTELMMLGPNAHTRAPEDSATLKGLEILEKARGESKP